MTFSKSFDKVSDITSTPYKFEYQNMKSFSFLSSHLRMKEVNGNFNYFKYVFFERNGNENNKKNEKRGTQHWLLMTATPKRRKKRRNPPITELKAKLNLMRYVQVV